VRASGWLIVGVVLSILALTLVGPIQREWRRVGFDFAYGYGARPTVTAIEPRSGPINGGQQVTITGTNFVAGKTTVRFGDRGGVSVIVLSSTRLTVLSPPSTSPRPVNVLVTTPAGRSSNTPADDYRYLAAGTGR